MLQLGQESCSHKSKYCSLFFLMAFNFCSPSCNGFVSFRYESHFLRRTPFTVKYLHFIFLQASSASRVVVTTVK